MRSRTPLAAEAALEGGKKLLRRVDDHVRLLRLEALARMDSAPADRDRVDSGRLRGADVERRVADVDGLVAGRAEQPERMLERRRVRLVPLGVVGADDHVEELLERQVREREANRLLP